MLLVASRREAIIAAVEAHNRAHKPPLPRSAGRLLTAMFASDDTCQQSLDALLEASGVSRPTVQSVLRTLLAAGIIAKEETGQGTHANRYRLHLPTEVDA
jgi:DNA-binding transcriptional regulator GbsR (MarR family)